MAGHSVPPADRGMISDIVWPVMLPDAASAVVAFLNTLAAHGGPPESDAPGGKLVELHDGSLLRLWSITTVAMAVNLAPIPPRRPIAECIPPPEAARA
jgi:hypothetical protein